MKLRHIQILFLIFVAIISEPLSRVDGATTQSDQQRRYPVGLALSRDGTRLFSANERSGTISTIDTRSLQVISEQPVGIRLSAILRLPQTDYLIAADLEEHHLLFLRTGGEQIQKELVHPVIRHPVHLTASEDGRHLFVAGLWSRKCQILSVKMCDNNAASPTISLKKEIELPFEPLRLLHLPDSHKLVVTAAFGGQVAVIDVESGQIDSIRTLRAHNIRGLAFDKKRQRAVLTHQTLDPNSPTIRSHIQWGFLMTNYVRLIPAAKLLESKADLDEQSQWLPVGDAGDPAGDPDNVVVLEDGRLAVTLAGVGEIAILNPETKEERRTGLGKRPTALIADYKGTRLFAAATFSDVITTIDPDPDLFIKRIRLGPRADLTLAERGEQLFYDAQLSFRGWMSCHSCHTDGHSNGLLNDNEGDESFGAPKRVLSLLGVGETGPWAWNGKQSHLEDQVRKSIRSSMQGNPEENDVAAISAFLRTLKPPPTQVAGHPSALERGSALFQEQRCYRCHEAPTFTSNDAYKVGLVDEVGVDEFNPPSLRGVRYRQTLFHDNRARSLEDVFRKHQHQLKRELTEAEVKDLATFLRSL